MPRTNFEDGVEIVKSDLNAIPKALGRELYDRLAYELMQRAENAFFQDSFLVSYSSANQVIVNSGLGFQTDATQVSPEPQKRPLYLAADSSPTISTPDSVNDRIDIVCVKSEVANEITATRKFKDASTSVISNQSLVIQKDWSSDIVITAGTPGVSPVAPATPAGYLKIAEIEVTAVSGIAGSGAITDTRSIIPLGGSTTINTTGFDRLPASAAESLEDLFTSVDSFLKNGHFEYFDIDELGAAPAAPSAGQQRMFLKDNVLYLKNSASTLTPVGSGGGGGGGGANWQPVSGLAPNEDYEYDEKVWLFEQSALQALTLWVKVPTSYIAGRQIVMKAAMYSPSTSNKFKFQAVSSLVRKNNDAVTSTTNQNTSNSGDLTNAVANRMREISIDITSSLGTINSVAVSAGDMIKVTLSRIASAATEDSADIRFIPTSTEILFS